MVTPIQHMATAAFPVNTGPGQSGRLMKRQPKCIQGCPNIPTPTGKPCEKAPILPTRLFHPIVLPEKLNLSVSLLERALFAEGHG